MLARARVATLAYVAFVAMLLAFAVAGSWTAGARLAVTLLPTSPSANATFRVAAVSPPGDGSLRVGDVVAIGDPALRARVAFSALRPHATIAVERIAPGPPRVVTIPVRRVPLGPFVFAFRAIGALLLAMAALLTIRARSRGPLSLAVLFTSIVGIAAPVSAGWPDWALATYALGASCLLTLGSVFAIDFATLLRARADDRAGRRVRRWSARAGVVAALVELAVGASNTFQTTTPVVVQDAQLAALVALPVGFVATLGWVYATATERARVSWVVASLGIGIAGLLCTIVMSALAVPEPVRDYPLLLIALAPIGCGYAILRYRVLDVGFVANRAAVFGVTSLIVLGALALVDLALQHVVGSWLVASGTAIQVAVALAIGFATRPLHARVDAFVDDVFFRERNAADRALRELARDVAFVDDAAVALERCVTTIARTAGVRCDALLRREGDGDYRSVAASADDDRAAPVGRNDEAVVRMLATRAPLDLAEVATTLDGDFAFPMFARTRLLGILVCAERAADAESYAPDRIAAIAAVASALGVALDLLRVEALERELAALRAPEGRGTVVGGTI